MKYYIDKYHNGSISISPELIKKFNNIIFEMKQTEAVKQEKWVHLDVVKCIIDNYECKIQNLFLDN